MAGSNLPGTTSRPLFAYHFHAASPAFPYSLSKTHETLYNILFSRGFRRPCSPLPPTRTDLGRAKLGFLAVLHTWNQQMGQNPSLMMPGIIISFVFPANK